MKKIQNLDEDENNERITVGQARAELRASLNTDPLAHKGEMSNYAKVSGTSYPAFAVTADMALFTIKDGQFSVLLVKRKSNPYKNAFALPGGYVDIEEGADLAAVRELREETGVDLKSGYLEQLKTYSKPGRDPRMRTVTVAHIAFYPIDPNLVLQAGDDAAQANWFSVNELFTEKGPALAFDHEIILNDAIDRCRSKLEYTTLATEFLPKQFTIGELRRIYEAVWGEVLTRSNFSRKVKSIPGFLIPVGHRKNSTLYKQGWKRLINPPIMREGFELDLPTLS